MTSFLHNQEHNPYKGSVGIRGSQEGFCFYRIPKFALWGTYSNHKGIKPKFNCPGTFPLMTSRHLKQAQKWVPALPDPVAYTICADSNLRLPAAQVNNLRVSLGNSLFLTPTSYLSTNWAVLTSKQSPHLTTWSVQPSHSLVCITFTPSCITVTVSLVRLFWFLSPPFSPSIQQLGPCENTTLTRSFLSFYLSGT